MEPFHVMLKQLTYEEEPQEGISDQILDSFSNIVHYDTQFPQSVPCFPSTNITTSYLFSRGHGVPIISPKPQLTSRNLNKQKAFAQPSQVKTSHIYSQSIVSPDCLHQCALINPNSNFVDSHGFLTRVRRGKVSKCDLNTVFQVASNTQLLKTHNKRVQKPQYKMSTSDTNLIESSEVDAPFETVADALHLQWSVIGDKKITPVSADVVAQVVAEAQKKLKKQSQNSNDGNLPEEMQVRECLPSSVVGAPDVQEIVPANDVQTSGKQELDMYGQKKDKTELIPISAESIVRSRDKPSWLAGMGDNTSYPPKESQRPVQGPSNEGDISLEDRDDSVSVSSSQGELEVMGQSDTDKFIRSLPPITQIDLSAITPKTKFKQVAFSPAVDTFQKPADKQNMPCLMNGENIYSNDNEQGPSAMYDIPDSDKIITSTPIKPYKLPPLGPLFYKPKTTPASKVKTALSYQEKDTISSRTRIEDVMKEKAKLEGQLEMLTEEAKLSLKEKTELQANIATLKQRLKNNQESINDQEKDMLRSDYEKIKKAKHLLEMSLCSANKFLEEKTNELKFSQEELNATQETNLKLQMNIKNARDELRSREVTIQALKNKIAELYVEVQSVMQSKMESDNEARVSKNDLASLINTKNWYQHQLQAAQEARGKLQTELTKLQGQADSQNAIIEKLKFENSRLRQQVKDVQQKSIKEKEMLARHLETIQSDILQRESALQEIQKERTMYEKTFDVKMKSIEDEKSQVRTLMKLTSDLEKQLDLTHDNLKGKQSQILSLENEQIDLMKKLTISQESVAEKDEVISELQHKLIEVESGLEAFSKSVEEKQAEIWKLKEEKASVEISLRAAKEEKQTVDKVLDSLKGDMTKVKQTFKCMKQDITTKDLEYDSLRKEKNSLQDEVETVKEYLEKVKLEQSQAQKDESSSEVVEELRKEKIRFEEEVKYLKEELDSLQDQNNQAVKCKDALESELIMVKQKLSETDNTLLSTMKALEDAKSLVPASAKDEEAKEQTEELKDELLKENDEIKDLMKKREKQHQREFTKQKAKTARLNQDLTNLQQELTNRQAAFDSNVEILSGKIRELTSENEHLATELEMAKKKFELSTMQYQDQQNVELQKLAKQLEASQLEKQALENQLYELQRIKDLEVKDYQEHLSALEDEITQQRELLATAEDNAILNEQLSLELEKEKGKVEAILSTNQSLKTHVCELEDAISRRESAFTDLEGQTREIIGQHEKEGQEKAMKIQHLEEELQREKTSQRDVRKQIGLKITENKKLKRQNDSIQTEKEALQQDLEHVTKQLEALQAEHDVAEETWNTRHSQLQVMGSENKDLSQQLDRVQRELADNMAKEMVMKEQIENLKWQLDQKTSEINAIKHQTQLSQGRHEMEISTLNKTLQDQLAEIDTMRRQLIEARQEKSQQQIELSQLRSTLKASVQHHKLTQKLNQADSLNAEDSNIDKSMQLDVIIPPLPFDLEAVENLLQESTMKALQSKPLDNLQSCLSSLRSEISGLQKQMQDHLTVVEVTTQSWDQMESQMDDLQTMVKSLTTDSFSFPVDSLSGAGVDIPPTGASSASSVFEV